MNIKKALIKFYSNNEWVLRGNDYSGLEWLDETIPKPTEKEIEEQIEQFGLELPEPEPLTPQQKLESIGLTTEELKKILGL